MWICFYDGFGVCVCALINFYDGLGVCVCEYAFIMVLVCVCVCVCVCVWICFCDGLGGVVCVCVYLCVCVCNWQIQCLCLCPSTWVILIMRSLFSYELCIQWQGLPPSMKVERTQHILNRKGLPEHRLQVSK